MVSSIYKAEVKLNPSDDKYHNYIIVENDNGVLMINRGLFVISFNSKDEVDVEIINKKHIGDISL